MSAMAKKSFRLSGHATSVALEPEFWAALEAIAKKNHLKLAELVGEVDKARGSGNLASALRLKVLHDLNSTLMPATIPRK